MLKKDVAIGRIYDNIYTNCKESYNLKKVRGGGILSTTKTIA